MKASLNWLRELLPALGALDVDATEIARRLTGAGIEVEGISTVGDFHGVIVAEVRDKRPHPKADKLTLVDVWDGREVTQVVCGAPNVPAPGGKVAWARPGARLPDGRVLEAREVRGVLSPGMLCAEDELGLGVSHEGIVLLDEDATPGRDVAELLGFPDTVFDINVTPNRPDCMGHVGIARELAALFQLDGSGLGALAAVDLAMHTTDAAATGLATVRVLDEEGCPRYLARVLTGLRVGPSPLRLRLRLQALGVRAINNVVDATNLALLETGHPLHAFDLDRLAGQTIVVRRARPDERIVTLDGQERQLVEGDVVIADQERAVAVAGVMGGRDSEVSATTTRILLESAYFDPARVRRTARRLSLHTEASHRFERGADPEGGVSMSSARCARLIAELAATGPSIARGVIDVYPLPIQPRELALRPKRAQAVLGLPLSVEEQAAALRSIAVEVAAEGETLRCRVPSFRPDLTREIDLIEELGRLAGLDRVPTTLPPLRRVARSSTTQGVIERAEATRDALVALGCTETITYAFTGPERLAAFDETHVPLRIANPLREEQSALRTSLLPGLLAVIERNLAHAGLGDFGGDLRLFELGTVFLQRDEPAPRPAHLPEHGHDERLPEERRRVAVALSGRRAGGGERWLKPGEELDYFDLKGLLEALLGALRIAPGRVDFRAIEPDEQPWLHPGLAAVLLVDGRSAGAFGELHPALRERYGIDARILVAELELDRLDGAALPRANELPRYPGSSRDVSFFVAREVPAATLARTMTAASPLLESVQVLEDYREPGKVPAGHDGEPRKGMLFALRYRSRERTLTDEEVGREHTKVLAALEERFAIERR